ncbi:Uncharacterised protein [Mycobacterium tuberculosis]|nr:Uncharacterised protein [Mycobacterium tuberculosis]
MANHEVAFPTCGGCVNVEVDGLVLIDVGVVFALTRAKVIGLLQYRGLDIGFSELVLNFLEHFFNSGTLRLCGVIRGESFGIKWLAICS